MREHTSTILPYESLVTSLRPRAALPSTGTRPLLKSQFRAHWAEVL